MLGLTSRATPIRRIRIQRGPGSLFTHTSNNAIRKIRFQKKITKVETRTLKFSNDILIVARWVEQLAATSDPSKRPDSKH
jgi:hypothetical protein